RILELMDPAKDADGLHPMNLGRLVLNELTQLLLDKDVDSARAWLKQLLTALLTDGSGTHG
ncbi:hypothetical protein ACWEWQ_34420, partial [Streptomyces sp. NPDC003832]